MHIKSSVTLLGCVVMLAVSGCTTMTVGNAPDSNPPKLLKSDNDSGLNQGKIDDIRWDRPSAFGPVPANLQAQGDAACKYIDFYRKKFDFTRAIGYHPGALNLDGKPIAGGGYLCAR